MKDATIDTVLVGVDGSDESMVAAEYAVAIAERYNTELAILYVLDGARYRALTSGTADPEDLSESAGDFLAQAETLASDAHVSSRTATAYGYSARRKQTHPGSVVLDAAEDLSADFIVLPRGPVDPPGLEEGTLAKAAEYALLYASQPILAV